jgi:hypothetical protein
MAARRRQLAGAVLYWVTVRDEDTTELLNSWSFRTFKEAERKKIEQEEALDPPGRQPASDLLAGWNDSVGLAAGTLDRDVRR